MNVTTFGYDAISSSPYSAKSFLPPMMFHQTPFYKITYIESGSADVTFVSRKNQQLITKKCDIGDAFIVTPDDIHKYDVSSEDKYRHRDIYATPERMKECCDLFSPELYDEINDGECPSIFKMSANDIMSLSERLLVFVNNQPSKRLDGVHKSILAYMLGLYSVVDMEKRMYPEWIQELLRELDKLDVLKLPIEQILSKTEYSHSYVCRTFKQCVGVSLQQYINDRRLELSRVLVLNSGQSLEEIAVSLGLGTLCNYIKAFKKKYGMPPRKYFKYSLEMNTQLNNERKNR